MTQWIVPDAATSGNGFSIDSRLIGTQIAIPSNINYITTGGYYASGDGGGAQFKKATGTPTDLASFKDANNVWWQFVASGVDIYPEQFGAKGDGVTNDQPAIQGAVTFASNSSDVQNVVLLNSTYILWCPVKVSAPNNFSTDGIPIVITGNMALIGAASISKLILKGPTGGPRGTDIQPNYPTWLGGGIFILAGLTAATALDRVSIQNIYLDGGFTYTYGDARTVNLTDKGIRIQDTFLHRLEILNTSVYQFRGEILYTAASASMNPDVHCRQVFTNLILNGSPQSAFNPNGCGYIYATNVVAGNSYLPAEIVGGNGGFITDSVFHDGYNFYAQGGPQDNFQAGYHYSYPYRNGTSAPPYLTFNNVAFRKFENGVGFTSWIQGNIQTVDTFVYLQNTGKLIDTQLDINAVTDLKTNLNAIQISGLSSLTVQVPNCPAGVFYEQPQDLNINVTCSRTAIAQTNARVWNAGVRIIAGLMDYNSIQCNVYGAAKCSFDILNAGTAPAGFGVPLINSYISFEYLTGSTVAGASQVLSPNAAFTIKPVGNVMFISPQSAGLAATLDVTFNYARGFKFKVLYNITQVRACTFAKNGAGMFLAADASLDQYREFLELEYVSATNKFLEVNRLDQV